VYESHSGGILDTLAGLLEKAEAQLDEARAKETAAKNNFEMLKQSLTDEIKFADKDMAAAKKSLDESAETKAKAEGDLSATTKDLNEDTKSLADLHHDCMTKSTDFEMETKSRNEELAAIAKAKEIIIEATSLSQVSFLQVARSRLTTGQGLSQYEAVRFFRDLAKKQNSPALAQLANRMYATMHGSGDVFGKIKGLISDMIAKLEDEASADADKKAYCDKELSETNVKHEDKTAEISKLSAKIDQMTAKSAKLKEEVATLQKELAEIAASQAEMDKLRKEESAVYAEYKAENEKALKGIQLALKVLKDYYAKADKAHGAADGASSGIINLLEVCESDVSRGLAEATAAEEDAQLEYDTQTKDNELTTTTKTQDVKYKTKEAKDLDKAVADTTADKAGVQEELDAINKYLDELHGMCDEKVESYAERKEKREAEIAGLKEGLAILENEAALIQTKSRRYLRSVGKH
jgi:chromosome segregation ATPase